MKTIGMSENAESLPASELDHLLGKFFMNICKKNGEEYEPDTMYGFQLRSLFHEHGKGNKPQAATALVDDEEDALFKTGEFGDSNPVSLKRTFWWLLSLHFGDHVRKIS